MEVTNNKQNGSFLWNHVGVAFIAKICDEWQNKLRMTNAWIRRCYLLQLVVEKRMTSRGTDRIRFTLTCACLKNAGALQTKTSRLMSKLLDCCMPPHSVPRGGFLIACTTIFSQNLVAFLQWSVFQIVILVTSTVLIQIDYFYSIVQNLRKK